jgi:hypothetical protein
MGVSGNISARIRQADPDCTGMRSLAPLVFPLSNEHVGNYK